MVLRKYSQPEEVGELARYARKGLKNWERRILSDHFRPGWEVLDIGCGAGREAVAMAQEGFRVTGIDLVPELAEEASLFSKESGLEEKTRFLTMNACALAFPDDSFDGAVMTEQVINSVPGRESRLRALREAFRVLKKNGLLIMSSLSRNRGFLRSLFWRLAPFWTGLGPGERWVSRVDQSRSPGRIVVFYYTAEELLRDVRECGFHIEFLRSDVELERDVEDAANREKNVILVTLARKLSRPC
ncbi:MAG: class I SAM-dependent methyltransferase [Armatimonadetes bacterium]|nr:class I SAM-dependent methyltransferase [Armatimonadota bacterium]